MRALDKALKFAAQGLAVFPVLPSKAPACPHGFHDASSDPAVIRRLFERAPAADRIGIPTGAVTGIAVIDVDPAGMAWFNAKRYRFAATRTHTTPRGGQHLFFRHPPGLRCSAGKLAAGVDLKGDGGCITIWGPGYEVLDGRPVAEFPKWVLRRLAVIERAAEKRRTLLEDKLRAQSGPEAEARLADFVRRRQNGERNTGLFWAACVAGEENLSGASLIAAAVEVGLPYLEARTTVFSGLRRGRQAMAGRRREISDSLRSIVERATGGE